MPKGVNSATGVSSRYKDRAGTRNGRLLFTRNLGINAHKHTLWEAVCDCGQTTMTASPHKTLSCGCLHRETAAATQRAKAFSPEQREANRKANNIKQRARRRSDPVAVMQTRLSRLHRHALSQVSVLKTSPTFEQLGYTPEKFTRHIERQFLPGMSWSNMAEWQIDHIVPVSEARNEADVVALNQLSNLRPMWAQDNNSKKDKRITLL